MELPKGKKFTSLQPGSRQGWSRLELRQASILPVVWWHYPQAHPPAPTNPMTPQSLGGGGEEEGDASITCWALLPGARSQSQASAHFLSGSGCSRAARRLISQHRTSSALLAPTPPPGWPPPPGPEPADGAGASPAETKAVFHLETLPAGPQGEWGRAESGHQRKCDE